VCIGSPVANTSAWVVDSCLQPLPIGAAGELVIGGGGVSRGYFNDTERGDGPFIRIPVLSDERLCRTGDRVRRRGDGMLEYLGRIDDQLKVRGYRIEPAAIETLLRASDGIADAAVVAQGAPDAGAVLVAWCVADGGAERMPDVDALRAGLRRRLPEYMVPARFEWLGQLPRTPTGKPDRRALAARSPVSVAPGRGPRRPLSETEATVAQIWQRLLHTDLIDADDNFFDLGGQSLLGVRLLLEVEQVFGCALPLAALFESPTLAGFASRVLARHSTTDFQYVSPIWTGGHLAPLFCVHGAIRRLLPHLGTRRPVYLVYRQFDSDTFADLTVERLAAAYLQEIRRIQPHGPYHLCGFSFGGQVAYEIARKLRAEGETVGMLGLLDPPPVGGSAYTRVLASRKLAQIRSVSGVVPRLAFVVREIPAGLARMLKRRWLHALARFRERRGTPMATALLQERDRRNYIRASQTYRYREYPGSALLVMPERVEEILDTTAAAFDELIQQTLDVHIIRGARAHEDMMRDPFGKTLADILLHAMRDAESRTPLDNATGAPEPGSTRADPRPA
jgi:thioesterase domain-containing protein/acyl carrier protein